VLRQVIHDPLPVLDPKLSRPAVCAVDVQLLVREVVLAGVPATLFWIGVSHKEIVPRHLRVY
jgi:hypothetical protein